MRSSVNIHQQGSSASNLCLSTLFVSFLPGLPLLFGLSYSLLVSPRRACTSSNTLYGENFHFGEIIVLKAFQLRNSNVLIIDLW